MGRFKDLLASQDQLILHGALGTELEYRGHDVSGQLWSAKYLLTQPELIKAIHKDYILAGCDLVTTSTYQATLPGLAAVGLTADQARDIIKLTVTLAKEARDEVWSQLTETEQAGRPYPLISGDVGPYAAYLADGSEYTGRYDIGKEALKDFHRERIAILVDQGVDLLALETVPNFLEIQALSELLVEDFPQLEAYLSVTSQDGLHLSDGTPLPEVAAYCQDQTQVLALGLNCSSPLLFNQALTELRQACDKPLVTYPNSGELYDGSSQTWHANHAVSRSLLEMTRDWQAMGAKVVGGCCRTRPSDIADLAQGLRTRA